MNKLDKLIKWQFESHINMTNEHALMEVSTYKNIPIRRETHTKYRNGNPGKSEVIYWTPENPKNYNTLEELLRYINMRGDRNECR
ncbi:hypothetical protein [Gudongella sp. SC589]|uniref:hypothetical protein n=1 Tax=Gudongella sp. SC589 TaxID=3385990 RepID=UPI003904B845